jgi:hypothetical protein
MYNDIQYTVKLINYEGTVKWGVFENDNFVYACDDFDDAVHYMETYKMLMR